MISLLASVRDLAEAQAAAAAGADLIDLKEPSAGALGGLPIAQIDSIVAALRERWPKRPVSATIGDFRADDHAGRGAQAAAVARCGVDYVKAGIEPGAHALAALQTLAALQLPAPGSRPSGSRPPGSRPPGSIVIVFLADRGVDLALAERAAAMGFAGLMLDTADKSTGSLLRHADRAALAGLLALARRHGCLSGLAGSLTRDDVAVLRQLAPDFAGFRGAVCDGDRRGRFNPGKLRALRAALRGEKPQREFPGKSLGQTLGSPSDSDSSARSRAGSDLPRSSIG